MNNVPIVSLILITLAGLFAGLAFRDYAKVGGGSRPARKTWLLISGIFAVVGTALIVI